MRNDAIRQELQNTVTLLAKRWGGVRTSALRSAFRILARGSPVRAAELAASSGRDIGEVEQALASACENDMVGLDAENRLVELYGVRFSSGAYRVQFVEGTLFSCCALVSLMVGPLVGARETTIESEDPITRTLIRLNTFPGGILGSVPAETVGTMVTLRPNDLRSAISTVVCSHIRYFSSPQSAQQFLQIDSRRFLVSLNQLQWAANELCARVWGVG